MAKQLKNLMRGELERKFEKVDGGIVVGIRGLNSERTYDLRAKLQKQGVKLHVVKNSPNRELAFKLIEASLSPEVQTTLMNPPYLIVPTNSKVTMGGEIARVLAKDTAELKQKFVFQDWKKINEQRSAWIERFNREIKI